MSLAGQGFDPAADRPIQFPDQLFFLSSYSPVHDGFDVVALQQVFVVLFAQDVLEHLLFFFYFALEVLDPPEGVVLVGSEEGTVGTDLLLLSQTDDVHYHVVLSTNLLPRGNSLHRRLIQEDLSLLFINGLRLTVSRQGLLLQLQSHIFVEGKVDQVLHLMGLLAKLANEYFLLFYNFLKAGVANVMIAGERMRESGHCEAPEALTTLLCVFHHKI